MNSVKNKFFLIFSLLVFGFLFFSGIKTTLAAPNVSGKALLYNIYFENCPNPEGCGTISWVVFNEADCDAFQRPYDGEYSCRVAKPSSYGIEINDDTGDFNGRVFYYTFDGENNAFTNSYGWINFDGVRLIRLNTNTGKVSGTAQIVSLSSLSGTINFDEGNVTVDFSSSPYKFHGTVPFGDYTLSFNCSDNKPSWHDCDAADDFVVLYSPEGINNPPIVESISNGSEKYCTSFPGMTFIPLSWIYKDNDTDDNQTSYHLKVFEKSSGKVWIDTGEVSQNIPCDCSSPPCNPCISSGTSALYPSNNPNRNDQQIAFGIDYIWQVRVKDSNDNWSEWSSPLEVKSGLSKPPPWPSFNYSPAKPAPKTSVFFDDKSKCYTDAGNEVDCSSGDPGLTNVTYFWEFDIDNEDNYDPDTGNPGSPTSNDVGDTSHYYFLPGNYKTRLTVTESGVFCSTDIIELGVYYPPKWIEIPPSF